MKYSNTMLDKLEKAALAFLIPKKAAKPIVYEGDVAAKKKGLAAAKIISKNFPVDKRPGLMKIVAKLLEVDPAPMLSVLKLKPGIETDANDGNEEDKFRAIVMLENQNNHNYVLNRPAFFKGVGEAYCLQFRDSRNIFEGNHAPCQVGWHDRYHNDWRYATAAEIKKEIARVKKMRA